jgi:hypothetical protein
MQIMQATRGQPEMQKSAEGINHQCRLGSAVNMPSYYVLFLLAGMTLSQMHIFSLLFDFLHGLQYNEKCQSRFVSKPTTGMGAYGGVAHVL